MTQEEILDYNRRCTKFLGVPNLKDAKGDLWDILRTNQKIYSIRTSELPYHSDWNYIMEVVEAIEKLYEHPNKEVNVDIRPGQIEIFQRPYKLEGNDYHEIIYLGDGYINNSKKEAVVQAINQFLIWYNGQRA